jgi:hypothetical protein
MGLSKPRLTPVIRNVPEPTYTTENAIAENGGSRSDARFPGKQRFRF